ncbi:AI-2E family transporter [Geomonas sp.]|uniref:AI-2E family transporter n=1 Tax=Geomonas sp. TaxID=2651584 RepID=UPI002B488CC2|nr:AI-2E family transporter [Geomonas sp.]HJV35664.1 AI-2E family transporter [Geomonas sp.]
MPSPLAVSYLLAAFSVYLVLEFHLLSAVLAGLAVYVLTSKLARRLPARWGSKAHGIALAGIILVVAALVAGIFFGLFWFFQSHGGMASLTNAAAETLDNVKRSLPPALASKIPEDVEEVRGEMAALLRRHSQKITHAGRTGVRVVVHVLFGMVIGGIAVLHRLKERENPPPLVGALHNRLRSLADAFEKVVFAQVKISSINTVLTAIYLEGILPLCGMRLPMSTLLILLTFVTGLLPVAGNLISNTLIVLIALGVSPAAGVASLVFLLIIHKLEYVTNAKIVGGRIKASSWEILSAMLVMEAVFGLAGMIAAPVVYAWLKSELKDAALV